MFPTTTMKRGMEKGCANQPLEGGNLANHNISMRIPILPTPYMTYDISYKVH